MAHGPDVGLALLAKLDQDSRVKEHYRLDTVRAHLLERSGKNSEALCHYTRQC